MSFHYPPASNLGALLDALRTVPADAHSANEEILAAVYNQIMQTSLNPTEGVHWFCELADPLTREAAAFSLRLFAYQSEKVARWKEVLHDCLSGCAPCVAAFEMGKINWRATYFGAFSVQTLQGFFSSLEQWELGEIITDISQATPPSASTSDHPSTSIRSGTLYRMMSNWTIFSDPRVQSYLQSHVPPQVVPGWPEQSPPVYALVLLVIGDTDLQAWAKGYLSQFGVIPTELLSTSYAQSLSVVIRVLEESSQPSLDVVPTSSTLPRDIQFAEQSELWSGVDDLLRHIPPQWFKSGSGESLRLRRVILTHLQDQSSYFPQVFRCFHLLLKRLNKGIWLGEGPECPQTTLDSIKDNPRYIEALEAARPPDSGMGYLIWYPEYLSTLRDNSNYDDIFTNIIDFLSTVVRQNDLHHSQPLIANILMKLLKDEYDRLDNETTPLHRSFVEGAIDNRADIIIPLAYGNRADDNWKHARKRARELTEKVLEANIKSIQDAIFGVCEVLVRSVQKVKVPPLPVLSVQEKIWKTLYSTIQSYNTANNVDSKALAKVICIISKISHITPIRTEIFKKEWNMDAGDKILEDINKSLIVIQDGFAASISAYSDYSTSSNELIQCEGAGSAITLLLLSPSQDLQTAAKTLVGLAFDVDGRMECFRSMFAKLPSETFNGTFEYLRTFAIYGDRVPEACSLSAMLVLCFADILEVFCDTPDGLLHDQKFLKSESDDGPAAHMLTFWRLLTRALSLIYKRTPTWASHIDAPDMVIWMRDALILARDVLKQWRVIESAVKCWSKAPTKPTKRGKKSIVGEQMLQSLQEFLPELVRWLRLTDEELLHQSFALLFSVFDVLKESNITPSPIAIEKLSKYCESAKKAEESTSREQKTRLDQGRLQQLAEVLVVFETKSDNDEVEVIAHTIPTVKPTKDVTKSKHAAPIPERRPYIQGKSTQHKPVAQPKISAAFSTTSRKVSSKFSERDQQKLEAAIPQASFRRNPPVAGPSKASTVDRSFKSSKKQEDDEGSSEQDTDSDASESDDSLQNLGKPPSPKKIKVPKQPMQPQMPKERRGVQYLEVPLNANRARWSGQRQQVPTVRPRPDCSELHKTILSWDYTHSGTTPPGPPLKLLRVPTEFRDYAHYFQVFQPLLLLECWAQILAAKEERREFFQCKVESKQTVSAWLDVDLTIDEPVKRDWYLAETDIVLLHEPTNGKYVIGKVKSYTTTRGIHSTVRCFFPHGETDEAGLVLGVQLQISKLLSLSTLDREYRALLSMQYSNVSPWVMRPSLQKLSAVDAKDLRETMQKYKVNEPQATAILKALEINGVSLIQGPPGTGKTSTICGLIARFVANRPRPIVSIIPGQRKNATADDTAPTARVLVCAPSNAAIDELAQRIRDGLLGANVNVVRIGPVHTINASIRDISLDYLIDKKLDATSTDSGPSSDAENDIRAVKLELTKVKVDLNKKKDELQDGNLTGARRMTLEHELRSLNSRRQALNIALDSKTDKRKQDSRAQDTARRLARQQILFKADIICSTLAGAGHESIDNLQFDMIVIDEAAQAIELSSVIPLRFEGKHCIMVGDPQQLPPTVISPEATNFGYNQSLFVRLQRSNADAVHLLSIQYRMHPEISRLPSRVFYDGRLADGPDMALKTQQPWHKHDKFGTYKLINVHWGVEEQIGRSQANSAECKVAADIFDLLRKEFSNINFDFRIGVVSMYKAQIQALRRTFQDRFGVEILKKIDFNTVDGFQGQEKDIIILSCVRAGPGLMNIGFLSDVRRMNVALTRAKSSLFILGNAATLERSNETWRDIVHDARSREKLASITPAYYVQSSSRPATLINEPVPKKRKLNPSQPATPKLSTPQEIMTATTQAPTNTSALAAQSLNQVIYKEEPNTTSNTIRGTKRPAERVDHLSNSDLGSRGRESMETTNDRTPNDHQLSNLQNAPASSSSVQQTSISGAPVNKRPKAPKIPKEKAKPSIFIPKKKPPPGKQ